jgi:hypothetical protein
MSKLNSWVFASCLLIGVSAGSAFAQSPAAPPATQPSQAAPSSSGAAAEVKAAKGVEKREPVEPGTTFEKGTTVWAWSLVTGAEGTTVKHVWKKDGVEVWHANLKIGSKKWTTYSRRKLTKPGAYSVEVVGEDGSTLGSVDITVQ